MAPQTRRTSSFPKVVIERDTDSEESSSSEEIDDGDDDAVDQEEESDEEEEEEEVVKSDKSKGNEEKAKEEIVSKKAPITISLKKVCKVSYLDDFLLSISQFFFLNMNKFFPQ